MQRLWQWMKVLDCWLWALDHLHVSGLRRIIEVLWVDR